MGNSPQKPSALAATYGSDGYKNLPGSSSAGKKVEWVILNHNNHQREIDVYIYIQDGSKTVQEPKPLHIRNRTGPEPEKPEPFGIEPDGIDGGPKEPERGKN